MITSPQITTIFVSSYHLSYTSRRSLEPHCNSYSFLHSDSLWLPLFWSIVASFPSCELCRPGIRTAGDFKDSGVSKMVKDCVTRAVKFYPSHKAKVCVKFAFYAQYHFWPLCCKISNFLSDLSILPMFSADFSKQVTEIITGKDEIQQMTDSKLEVPRKGEKKILLSC